MMPLRAMAAALGGEVSGHSVLAPGPGHSKRDRSLSVMPSATAPDGLLVHSFCADGPIACKDYVRARLGLPSFGSGQVLRTAPSRPRTDNREAALRIWWPGIEPRGTLVEAYLRSRGLELPREAAFEAIRFHPDCPFGLERFPAMVCLVRNIVTNERQAIHRTALTVAGTAVRCGGKTFRLNLGSIAGGATKLDPDEEIEQGLCIGEGVETCLAGRQMGLRPVWSAVNTGGVKSFPVLPGVDGLHLFKENDSSGTSAEVVEACARRWYDAGRNVVIVESDVGNDLNDELREAAR
jgi:putative DNA primase/helicase